MHCSSLKKTYAMLAHEVPELGPFGFFLSER